MGRIRIALQNLVIACLCAACGPVFGQGTSGSWLSDLWWNPNESGWGVTVDHQETVMFLTFFIHRADGSPYWVTAQLSRTTPGTHFTIPVAYAGDVYETRGTYFGVPFNPAQTFTRKVGTATFNTPNGSDATLTYSVDGVATQRSIERQTLRHINYRGNYLGGVSYETYNCTSSSLNGRVISDAGTLTVSHFGTALSIIASGQTGTCTFSGQYSQRGVLGFTTGDFTCTDGTRGSFLLSGMQWTITGMSAILVGRSQYCDFGGVIGGITAAHTIP